MYDFLLLKNQTPMLQFETHQAPDDLFNLFPKNELHEYLWEMLQGWVIFLTQREKNDMDIATRLYFYELLNHLLSYHYHNRKKYREIPEDNKTEALRVAFIELLRPMAIYRKEDQNIQFWYLLLPHLSPDEHDEVERVVGLLRNSRGGNQVHCISSAYLKKNMEDGNPYMVKEILPTQPIYHSQGFEGLPTLSKEDLQKIFKKATSRLESGLAKAQDFWDLSVGSNQEICPFLYHQAAEMALRSVLLAWENLEKKTHEIRVLIRFAAKYNAEFGKVFLQEEDSLLTLLDKCYTHSRYQTNFRFPEELLAPLASKVSFIMDLTKGELERLRQLAFFESSNS